MTGIRTLFTVLLLRKQFVVEGVAELVARRSKASVLPPYLKPICKRHSMF